MDLLHACRTCGYDERIGQHGIVGQGSDASHVVLQCLVPASAKPVTFYVLTLAHQPDIGADVPGGGAI